MGADVKKLVPIVLLLAAAVAVFCFLRSRPPSTSQATTEPSASSPATASTGQNPSPRPETDSARSPGPASTPSLSAQPPAPQKPAAPFILGSADVTPAMEPATVLGNMRIAIQSYGSMFGGNPVGTNPEIAAALNGENPKQVRFIKDDSGLRINGRGELVDYWGTRFFFHQLSGSETEIRSAGPDKTLWTSDDLIIK